MKRSTRPLFNHHPNFIIFILMDFDHPTLPLHALLCCLCGDLGFPAKLFRCANCSNRFQHSYCSNYYYGKSEEAIEVCDWCRSEQRSGGGRGSAARKSVNATTSGQKGSSHHKITHQRERSSGGAPSPRLAPRRYKLLKDVMC